MSDLEAVARKFKEAQLKGQGAVSSPNEEIDLDAQIEARMAAVMEAQAPAELRTVDAAPIPAEPLVAEPKPRTSKPAVVKEPAATERDVSWVLPPAANRVLGRRQRVTVELPVELEALRLSAKDKDMSSGHLVLSAMDIHRERVLEDALGSRFAEMPARGFTKKWQMMWHEEELAFFDSFVDEVTPMLPRRSRALVAQLLLECCEAQMVIDL